MAASEDPHNGNCVVGRNRVRMAGGDQCHRDLPVVLRIVTTLGFDLMGSALRTSKNAAKSESIPHRASSGLIPASNCDSCWSGERLIRLPSVP